jgi:NADH-quinone oxidoreductase subunit E
MLSDSERHEIEEELSRYPDKQAVCVDALKIVQRHHGWVSDEALKDVAALLEMSPHEVDGVATFYSLIYRRPVGRHVIHVCDSVSCWVMGCSGVCEHLKEKLGIEMGGTTPDGRFTLLPIVCLGVCDAAPAMMIGDTTHGNLTAERIDEILEMHG